MAPAPMGSAIALGLAFPASLSAPYMPGSILDADFTTSCFWDGAAIYTSIAAFLSAVGGTGTGGKYSIGPYRDPAAVELLTNGGFAGNDMTGWSTGQNANGPATWSAATGEAVMTGNGADIPRLWQGFAGAPGEAFEVSATLRRIDANAQPVFSFSSDSSFAGAHSIGASNLTTNVTISKRIGFIGAAAGSLYLGGRVIMNGTTGRNVWDGFSAKRVKPFASFEAGTVAGVVTATAGPSIAHDEVLLQLDDDATDYDGSIPERHLARLYRAAADRHLHLLLRTETTYGTVNTQADLDFGVVADSTQFTVAFSLASNNVSGSLNGATALTDITAVVPSMAALRLGQALASGKDWTGSIERVVLF